jgi:hypothetical protein
MIRILWKIVHRHFHTYVEKIKRAFFSPRIDVWSEVHRAAAGGRRRKTPCRHSLVARLGQYPRGTLFCLSEKFLLKSAH